MSSKKIALLCTFCGVALMLSAGTAAAEESEIVLTIGVKEEVSIPDEQGMVQVIHREVEMADPARSMRTESRRARALTHCSRPESFFQLPTSDGRLIFCSVSSLVRNSARETMISI